MGITRFFVDAFGSAIQQGLATHDDLLRHATPDVLSRFLPRPLWAKLLTACLAAKKVDSKSVVEAITLEALCEAVPGTILWTCLAEIGGRALGSTASVAKPAEAGKPSEAAKPAEAPAAAAAAPLPAPPSPSTPLASPRAATVPARAQTEPPVPLAARTTGALSSNSIPTVTGPSPSGATPVPVARTSSAPVSRPIAAGASTRRTQSATDGGAFGGGPPAPPPKGSRAPSQGGSFEVDVEEEQLIDWAQSEENGRKS